MKLGSEVSIVPLHNLTLDLGTELLCPLFTYAVGCV